MEIIPYRRFININQPRKELYKAVKKKKAPRCINTVISSGSKSMKSNRVHKMETKLA